MTRAAVRATQMDADPESAGLLRVTVTAIQDQTLTVQLPGGATVTAPRVAGCAYSTGATAFAIVQEPGIGPILPIGGSATPVGKHCKASSAATQTIVAGAATQIPVSAAVNDDSSLFAATGGGIQVARAGLYLVSYYAQVTCGSGFSIFPRVNGSTKQETGAPSGARVSGTAILRLDADDLVTLWTFTSADGSVIGSADPKDVGLVVAFQGS